VSVASRLTTQPAPTGGFVLLTAVLALLLVWAPGAWPTTRHVVTIAHEAAHGVGPCCQGASCTAYSFTPTLPPDGIAGRTSGRGWY